MTGPETIQEALRATKAMLNLIVDDFADEELLVRPVEGANHLAWQIGHLAMAEGHLVREQLPDVNYPEFPEPFAATHGSEGARLDDPALFVSKSQYLERFNQARDVTIEAVGKLSEADLERPTQGRIAGFAPKLGNLLILVSNHTLMHFGQFSVVRRKLGKPVKM